MKFITPPGAYSFQVPPFTKAYARFSPGMLLQLENFLPCWNAPEVEWADSLPRQKATR